MANGGFGYSAGYMPTAKKIKNNGVEKQVRKPFSADDAKNRTTQRINELHEERMAFVFEVIEQQIGQGNFKIFLQDPKSDSDSMYGIYASEEILNELKDQGYTVTPEYKVVTRNNDTGEEVKELKGYNISWGAAG